MCYAFLTGDACLVRCALCFAAVSLPFYSSPLCFVLNHTALPFFRFPPRSCGSLVFFILLLRLFLLRTPLTFRCVREDDGISGDGGSV